MKPRHSHAFREWKRPRRLNSKNLSKIGQSVLELWIFEVLVDPYYGHLQVGSSATICDVKEENFPLVMYIDFHKIPFYKLLGGGAIILILSEIMQK